MQVDYPIIEKLRPFLSGELEVKKLFKLEALRLELAEARVAALELLLQKRRQVLWPKDKEMTELDRKTRLDGDTAVYERNYQFLVQLEEIVSDRIALGQILLQNS